jgi:DNA-directed RNA polymerase omega subunit
MKHSNDRTAGLNSQVAVEAVGNRYDLVLIGARRVRELGRGDRPKLNVKHGHAVTAMLEIEAGLVTKDYLYRETEVEPRRRNRNYDSTNRY